MNRSRTAVLLLTAVLVSACASSASEDPAPAAPPSRDARAETPRAQAPSTDVPDGMRSSADGVYTAGQAQEGLQVFQGVCSECHTRDEFTGFAMDGWEGASLYDLYDLISNTMPESNPGSLSRSQYAAVVAFILDLNDMPTGTEELSTRASVLRNIIFTRGE